MKKTYLVLICLLVSSVLVFNNTKVHATVGGPTYINAFKYNPQDQSVYYIEHSSSGRGCPPELLKLSLISGKAEVVYSCDDGEKLMRNTNNTGPTPSNEIYSIIQDFKHLSQISLKANKIDIDVNLLNYEKFDPSDDYVKNANFIASIYQDGVKLADLSITGCNIKQPFTFAGYAIPGLNKKIVLLVSTKSDCFEGGYIGESLYVVGNINNLDRTYYSTESKSVSALSPNEGTLVIFEEDGIKSNDTNNSGSKTQTKYGFSIPTIVIYILIAMLIGVLVGKMWFSRR